LRVGLVFLCLLRALSLPDGAVGESQPMATRRNPALS
jgi:hypothetical protein